MFNQKTSPMPGSPKDRFTYYFFYLLLKFAKIGFIVLVSYFVLTMLLDFPAWMTALVVIGIIILI